MYSVGEDGVGLLKFDFLGIKNLSILADAVERVKKVEGIDVDIENVPGFILTIARNICINFKRNRRPNFTIEDFQTWTNDSEYEKKELLNLLSTSLELLETEYREAFVLRMYQGLSYKEIANITGDSISAIKNRVWRAKEKIKEILTPYIEDLSNY